MMNAMQGMDWIPKDQTQILLIDSDYRRGVLNFLDLVDPPEKPNTEKTPKRPNINTEDLDG